MAIKAKPKVLSREEERALTEDILTRIDLQRTMKPHSMPVLELEFGVWQSIIQQITHGQYSRVKRRAVQGRRLTPEIVAEIARRRRIWLHTHELLKDYSLQALADKYGCSTATIRNRVREVKAQSWQVPTREAA